MASPSHPETPCSFRFEFDPVTKVLLARVEGRLTDKWLVEIYGAVQKYSTVTNARAGIVDMSSVTEFAVSADCVRDLAGREPAMPDASGRPCVIVVASPIGFGFARMFQIAGEKTRRLLEVVHTLDEALAALGIQSPQFTPLESKAERRANVAAKTGHEVMVCHDGDVWTLRLCRTDAEPMDLPERYLSEPEAVYAAFQFVLARKKSHPAERWVLFATQKSATRS